MDHGFSNYQQLSSYPRESLALRPEIGVDHGFILQDLPGRAFGQLFAVVEHVDPAAEIGDEVDVMLDQEKGLPLGVEGADAIFDRFDERWIDAGRGFVQEQDVGVGHEGHADFEQAALSARQVACLLVGQMRSICRKSSSSWARRGRAGGAGLEHAQERTVSLPLVADQAYC